MDRGFLRHHRRSARRRDRVLPRQHAATAQAQEQRHGARRVRDAGTARPAACSLAERVARLEATVETLTREVASLRGQLAGAKAGTATTDATVHKPAGTASATPSAPVPPSAVLPPRAPAQPAAARADASASVSAPAPTPVRAASPAPTPAAAIRASETPAAPAPHRRRLPRRPNRAGRPRRARLPRRTRLAARRQHGRARRDHRAVLRRRVPAQVRGRQQHAADRIPPRRHRARRGRAARDRLARARAPCGVRGRAAGRRRRHPVPDDLRRDQALRAAARRRRVPADGGRVCAERVPRGAAERAALAFMGTAGGFLAPVLLSTGQATMLRCSATTRC